jgi:hypothetical protein
VCTYVYKGTLSDPVFGRTGRFGTSAIPVPSVAFSLPLSVVRLQRSDEQQIVDAVARRIPTWKAGLLNTARRLALTRATPSRCTSPLPVPCRHGPLSKLASDVVPFYGAGLKLYPEASVRSLGRWSVPRGTMAAWDSLICASLASPYASVGSGRRGLLMRLRGQSSLRGRRRW